MSENQDDKKKDKLPSTVGIKYEINLSRDASVDETQAASGKKEGKKKQE